VEVKVEYYDSEQEALLAGSPAVQGLRSVVGSTIKIPIAEFLGNYLLYRKRANVPGYRSYEEIVDKAPVALNDMDSFVVFNGKAIHSAVDPVDQIGSVTEHIGEAVGLAVVNRIHQTTMADWDRTAQERGHGAAKTLDWQIGSDGHVSIELETKGVLLRVEF
jgi:hypothetical protein